MDDLNKFCLVAIIAFMGNLIKSVVADQLQMFLEDTNTLDLFQDPRLVRIQPSFSSLAREAVQTLEQG